MSGGQVVGLTPFFLAPMHYDMEEKVIGGLVKPDRREFLGASLLGSGALPSRKAKA